MNSLFEQNKFFTSMLVVIVMKDAVTNTGCTSWDSHNPSITTLWRGIGAAPIRSPMGEVARGNVPRRIKVPIVIKKVCLAKALGIRSRRVCKFTY